MAIISAIREGNRLKCPVPGCSRTFEANKDYRRHYRSKHANLPPHKCPHCERTFDPGRPYQLSEHSE